jgi:hypothetical protein
MEDSERESASIRVRTVLPTGASLVRVQHFEIGEPYVKPEPAVS